LLLSLIHIFRISGRTARRRNDRLFLFVFSLYKMI
jgi:hypothetical protein